MNCHDKKNIQTIGWLKCENLVCFELASCYYTFCHSFSEAISFAKTNVQ